MKLKRFKCKNNKENRSTPKSLPSIIKNISKGLFFLLFISSGTIKAQGIYGDWIKNKVTYGNNDELSDDNSIKHQYLRYTFEKPNKFFMSVVYDDKGTSLFFDINSNIVQIKNSYGFVINSFLIKELTNDELILVQKGNTGFTDDDCLKYSFIKEKHYQNQLPIKPSDLLLISKSDTVFKSTEKIYAKFLGDKSFYNFCSENIPERDVVMATNNLFFASFIVRKTGIIDSIQVLENINKQFEKQFRKALDKSKRLWKPGEVDGRKVDVQMKITFRFFTSDKFLPMYDFSKKGKNALHNKDYSKALGYFELALEKVPTDTEILYYKAICEINLGNKDSACEDLAKIKISGKMKVDELIEKNCNGK